MPVDMQLLQNSKIEMVLGYCHYSDPTIIRRVYRDNDISPESEVTIKLNELPVTIRCNNKNLEEPQLFRLAFKSLHSDRQYYSLSTIITIFVKTSDIIPIFRKYNNYTLFSDEQLGLKSRLIPCPEGASDKRDALIVINNAICDKNKVPYTKPADEPFIDDYLTKTISFYLPYIKSQICRQSQNTSIKPGEVVLQGFCELEGTNEEYILFANHIFSSKIYSDTSMGEFNLLKNLLIRIMTLFDIPINTYCNKDTKYSVVSSVQNRAFM